MERRKLALLGAVASLSLGLTACAEGIVDLGGEEGVYQMNIATMVQPQTPNAPVQNWFLDEIESRSEGRIEVIRTEADSICKPAEIAECVRDGRVDIGISISDYTPQMFPTMSVATIPFITENPQAFMQANYHANTQNPDAAAAWDRSGVRLIASWSPGNTIIGSKEPVDDIGDLEGMRFRATGFYLQQAFQKVGANVIALTAPETYEGVERGLADAVSWTMDGPVDYKMMEQLPYWTSPGSGVYTTFAIWMNTNTYEMLPPDLKEIVDEVQRELIDGEGMKAFNSSTDRQCEAMLEFPGDLEFDAWDENATQEWKDEVQQELIDQWIVQAEKDGLNNPSKFLADYQQYLEEAESQPSIVDDPVKACIEKFASR